MAEQTATDTAVIEETEPNLAEEDQEPAEDVLPAEAPEEVEQATGEPLLATQKMQVEMDGLRTTLGERETEIQTLRHQLTSATEAYRGALLAASPEIPGEMVNGATPEEVDVSLDQARQMVERIRTHIEAQLAEQRVPSGAPIRSGQDLSSLSPQEKIAYGLSHDERS
jgi:hypothetical protein